MKYTENNIKEILFKEFVEYKKQIEEFKRNIKLNERNEDLFLVEYLSQFRLFYRRFVFTKTPNNSVLKKIGLLIEDILVNGDPELVKTFYGSFLENLNVEIPSGSTEGDIRQHLGPITNKALDGIDQFWAGK